jgi:curved DNA-binding protein CbpA
VDAEEHLPDYYAILQVHPLAEAEVVEGAYLRLMRKYHPDALSLQQRQDMETLQRVQAINAAYDVLSDPEQRAAYDQLRASPAASRAGKAVDTRLMLVLCASTRQTYRMMLGKEQGSGPIYQVLGFELVEDRSKEAAQEQPGVNYRKERLALPGPQEKMGLMQKIFQKVKNNKEVQAPQSGPGPRLPSQAEIAAAFQGKPTVSFTHIQWDYWLCPACQASVELSSGVTANWCYCNACQKIFCAGGVHSTSRGDSTRCPWCLRKTVITSSIEVGDEAEMPVRGDLGGNEKPAGIFPLLPHKHKEIPGKTASRPKKSD